MIAFAKPDNQIDALPLDTVLYGDCLAMLKTISSDSLDACVVDPPYGLGEVKDIAGLLGAWLRDEDDSPYIGKSGFMGKDWDAGVPGPRYWCEVYRVLKPGAHILCFAGTRTVDLMTIALRLAGFQCRDMLMWLHGQGFPKSTDISKKLDKMAGAKREVISIAQGKGMTSLGVMHDDGWQPHGPDLPITEPATSEAQQWQGFGTALKPAHEPIILARKPLSEPSIAANVLKWNTGGLNVDASRINPGSHVPGGGRSWGASSGTNEGWKRPAHEHYENKPPHTQGRWPANLLLSHSIWCVPNGTKRVRNTSGQANGKERAASGSMLDGMSRNGTVYYGEYEEVEDWHCAEDCPIRLLDEQSGVRKSGAKMPHHVRTTAKGKNAWGNGVGGGTLQAMPEYYPSSEGGASRYFTNLPPDVPFTYQPKASRAERNAGCEGLPEQMIRPAGERPYGSHDIFNTPGCGRNTDNKPIANNHPTVKPLALMRWLVRLVTPPDGIVLDPFLGSGSTAVACVHEGYHFIGIEQDASYVAISEARIAHARREVR